MVAASAGNHAQGVALAAFRAGLSATIVMPEWASISKQEATCNYGGQVILWGKSIGESLEKAKEIAAQGKTFIHPFDDVDIITGQGTLGLEILEDLPDTQMILAPVGGGGLISGIALAAKALSSGVQVIGVQAGVCPSAAEALHRGHVKTVRAQPSIADGISVRQIGKVTFEVLRSCVDRIALVDEASIASAILMLLERKKILAEGAGAVPLAALLNGAVSAPKGRKNCPGDQRRQCGQPASGKDSPSRTFKKWPHHADSGPNGRYAGITGKAPGSGRPPKSQCAAYFS